MDYLGLLSFLAIALPMTVILLNGVIGDAVIDAVVPGVYAGFEVFFARLYTLSLLALLLPICILVGVVCYLTFVFHPSQIAHQKRKEKMKRLELEASYQQTRTSKPWSVATVAPPSVLPIMTVTRGTGATSVSFRNPN